MLTRNYILYVVMYSYKVDTSPVYPG